MEDLQVKIRSMLAIVLVAIGVTLTAVSTFGQDLGKPLAELTLGDVFPGGVDAVINETGQAWQTSADELVTLTEQRAEQVRAALKVKQEEADRLRAELKDAKKAKDPAMIGTAEGQVKEAEMLLAVLKNIEKVADRQLELARAWREAGVQMIALADSSTNTEAYRAATLSRPAEGNPDQRLGREGNEAFKSHTDVMHALGTALTELGSEIKELAGQRLTLLKSLEKGGLVQPGS